MSESHSSVSLDIVRPQEAPPLAENLLHIDDESAFVESKGQDSPNLDGENYQVSSIRASVSERNPSLEFEAVGDSEYDNDMPPVHVRIHLKCDPPSSPPTRKSRFRSCTTTTPSNRIQRSLSETPVSVQRSQTKANFSQVTAQIQAFSEKKNEPEHSIVKEISAPVKKGAIKRLLAKFSGSTLDLGEIQENDEEEYEFKMHRSRTPSFRKSIDRRKGAKEYMSSPALSVSVIPNPAAEMKMNSSGRFTLNKAPIPITALQSNLTRPSAAMLIDRTRSSKNLAGVRVVKQRHEKEVAAPHRWISEQMHEKVLLTKALGNDVNNYFLSDKLLFLTGIEANDFDLMSSTTRTSFPRSQSVVTMTTVQRSKASEESKAMKKFLAVEELIATEKSYLSHLRNLVTFFLKPLRNKEELLLSSQDVYTVFGNIENLKELHDRFCKEIDKQDVTAIAQAFLKFADFFKLYSSYCANYKASSEKIHELRKNSSFLRFVRSQTDKLEGQELGSFLIMPVQRIPRYEMLLQEIMKYSNDSEYEILTQAFDKIHLIAEEVNRYALECERIHRLADIQDKLNEKELPFEIISPSRHLIKEYKAEEIVPSEVLMKKTFKSRVRRIFLFDDLILWTNSQYEYRGSFSLKSIALLVNDWKHPTEENPNCFEITDEKEHVLLCCESSVEKIDLIKAILIFWEKWNR